MDMLTYYISDIHILLLVFIITRNTLMTYTRIIILITQGISHYSRDIILRTQVSA
nr:MAG TPA: hypothetical protein [Caudoviricetes sp.]